MTFLLSPARPKTAPPPPPPVRPPDVVITLLPGQRVIITAP